MSTDELVKLIEQAGVQSVVVRGHNVMGCCPYHEERRPSWGMSTLEPHFHGCFTCHAKGTLKDFLIRFLGYSPEKAARLSGQPDGDRIDLTLNRSALDERTVPDEVLYPYAFDYKVVQWADSRGVSRRIAHQCGLVYNHHEDRIMFPWRDRGSLFGATGRALSEDTAKTLPYYGLKKSEHLYLPSGTITGQEFVLVEGETDALKIVDAGHSNTGALGHGRLSPGQVARITHSPATGVILFFDNDDTGRALTEEAAKAFFGYQSVKIARYPSEQIKDPGEMTRLQIRAALRAAKFYADRITI